MTSYALPMLVALGTGLLAWPLLEYVIHGVLSHRLRTFVSPLHWSHHRNPAAVFTSPVAWVPLAFGVLGLSAWAVGLALGSAFTSGLLLGFFRYEYVHWRIHFREARTRRQARLRSHHLAHHFVNPKAYHGVTTRFFDERFGTLPEGWEKDYARAAGRPPIEEPSNLGAAVNPAATLRVVATALRDGQR